MEVVVSKIRPGENNNFMNTEILTENTLNRLAKALMVRHNVNYQTATKMLDTFRLNVVAGEGLLTSRAQQAALLTAVNTGKRAFHGGVFVDMPKDVPCLLNWPGNLTLNKIVQALGGTLTEINTPAPGETLFIGSHKPEAGDGYVLHCAGWRGGITSPQVVPNFRAGVDFALGGIATASIAVSRSFLRISGLHTTPEIDQQGISLWRPDLDWLHPDAEGPQIEFLPPKVWMLGLGHLGQAYLWCLSFLPYSNPADVEFLLQDFDRVVKGNYASGLLCEEQNVGHKKTRICSDWLELRGFTTTIVERPFDKLTKRTPDEPGVACCGFDRAEPRRLLEDANFDLVVECGLGADSYRFDRLTLHTFPGAPKKASEIWNTSVDAIADPRLVEAFKQKDDCGIVAETLAKKAIASSFVGTFAGSLVVAEILKALHGGARCDLIQAHLRHGGLPGVAFNPEDYQLRIARSGFILALQNICLAA